MGDFALVTAVSLLKYQALGNDFLVALEGSGLADPPGREAVRRLCDRRRGVGADGLVLARPARAAGRVRMELYNSDGGRAETSGNGLRCLALALFQAGRAGSGRLVIETDSGEVEAVIGPDGEVSVSMGEARLGEQPPSPLEGFSARRVDVGNPHLVLQGASLAGLELSSLGPRLEASVPGGQNVEFVRVGGPDSLEMVVWERGAGLTAACGSGSVAAAAAARAAGLVGDQVSVENPGGRLLVELAGDKERPSAVLTGPATRVARVEVEMDAAGELAAS